ncbi:MAG: hypothetical protein MUO76_01435 [Anaerolineaceae bacterium]|jgi:hypothetical protein|nr:hypothetical protein [Anaerolineaceae bacterium]
MKTGMLWFDNDPKTDLLTKISKAANYYQTKYGQAPTLCFVHPSMLADKIKKNNGVEVRTSHKVLPHHLWLGVKNSMPVSTKVKIKST